MFILFNFIIIFYLIKIQENIEMKLEEDTLLIKKQRDLKGNTVFTTTILIRRKRKMLLMWMIIINLNLLMNTINGIMN